MKKLSNNNSIKNNAIPASNYVFKVNNIINKARCEICPKLIIKIPEGHHLPCSGVLLLTTFSSIFIVKIE